MTDVEWTRPGLLARIGERWLQLEAIVASFPADRRESPGPDGWSLKDHVAHVTAWERSLLALLRGEDRAAAVGLDRAFYDAHETDILVNAAIRDLHLADPFDSALEDFAATHREVLALLDGLDDSALSLPYSHYQPEDLPYNERPVIGWIAGNTFEHFEEHTGWLTALRQALA